MPLVKCAALVFLGLSNLFAYNFGQRIESRSCLIWLAIMNKTYHHRSNFNQVNMEKIWGAKVKIALFFKCSHMLSHFLLTLVRRVIRTFGA
jgi:hypothetical protein